MAVLHRSAAIPAAGGELVVGRVAGLDASGIVSGGRDGLLNLGGSGLRIVVDQRQLAGLLAPTGGEDSLAALGSLLYAYLAHVTHPIHLE